MEENENKLEKVVNESSSKKAIIIIIVILVILFLAAFVLMKFFNVKNDNLINGNINQTEKKDNDDINSNQGEGKSASELANSVIDIQEYISLMNTENNYRLYELDLKKAYDEKKLSGLFITESDNITLKYEINDYNIKLKLKDSNYLYASAYSLYVNDKYVYDDYAFLANKITVDSLGKYIVFRYNGCTDIRCGGIFVADDNGKVMTLQELDDVKGLIARKPVISNDGISLTATRITHNGAIVYDEKTYEVYKKDECEATLSTLSSNLLVEATYNYKYENEVLSSTPEISNRKTLKAYIDEKEGTLCN